MDRRLTLGRSARPAGRLTSPPRRSRGGPPARPAGWRGRCRSARAACRGPGRARGGGRCAVPTIRWAEATSMSDVSVHTWRSWTSTTPSTAARSARMASRSVPGGAAWTRMRTAWPARRRPGGRSRCRWRRRRRRRPTSHPVTCDDEGADDDADRADGVGEHLEVGALDVQRLLGALAQQGEGDEVGDEAGDGDDEHRAGEDVGRVAEAADRLDEDVDGDAEQQHRVGQGGEDLQPVQPERAVRALRRRGRRGGWRPGPCRCR